MARFSPEDNEQMLVKQQAEIADLRARLATAEAAENAPLRVRERQARLILDEMYQVVILLDTQGNELEINQSSLDIRASSPKDRIGKPPWKRMQPASAAKVFQDAILSVIATGEFKRFELEFTIPWRELEWMIMDFTLKPLRNAQGDVAFVLLESRDITQRKRAEEDVARKNTELQALYEQVSKLDQLKSMFFAMMNHELRTPLTLILGPTESLL